MTYSSVLQMHPGGQLQFLRSDQQLIDFHHVIAGVCLRVCVASGNVNEQIKIKLNNPIFLCPLVVFRDEHRALWCMAKVIRLNASKHGIKPIGSNIDKTKECGRGRADE